jgi:tRNA threonylcarbamoyladenosine biosynthesis protein TsaE
MEPIHGSTGTMDFTSRSAGETLELGRKIGALLPEGSVISLEGGLGVGKTLLAKGLCKGLGVQDEVVSPSFILVEEYHGVLPVLHFDLYRLERVQEVLDLGLFDAVDGRNIVVIEWGDKLPEGLLGVDVRIVLRITGGDEREISIEAPELFLRSLRRGER